MTEPRVVAYLGPSMPLSDARQIIDADYRPPIRRGDLKDTGPGTIVAMIDGVFEQELAVSPREVRDAVTRGVVIYGGSSMGALRAAEVRGVIGVGRVFEWYRDGVINRDDEVALLFDPRSGRAQTVPTVSIRFAVGRLCSLGTISREMGNSLISAALNIPYKERTYPTIFEAIGVASREDSQDLMAMLQVHDVKYRDAQAVLETIDRRRLGRQASNGRVEATRATAPGSRLAGDAATHSPSDREVLIWESGDRATYDDLRAFLASTGKLDIHARAVLARLGLEAGPVDATESRVPSAGAQRVFEAAAGRWGWASSEEAKVTLADLGLDQRSVGEHCAREALANELALELVREGGDEFHQALRAELFSNDLALKRETMRLGSLRYFAGAARRPATPEELSEARTVLCKVNGDFHFTSVRRRWARLGLSDPPSQDALVEQLARARGSARERIRAMTGRGPTASAEANLAGFGLGPCPKPAGESRFCLPIAVAEEHARRLGEVIGVTRVGMIGELADLHGVQIAQAARPGNGWSSSYGSGKARTREGAIVGSIMEEVEKWAQEQFRPDLWIHVGEAPNAEAPGRREISIDRTAGPPGSIDRTAGPPHSIDRMGETIVGSYRELRERGGFVDPATLDLPYDSVYDDDLPLHWHRCFDLLGGRELHLPVDPLQMSRRKHDIYYTQRGARKHLATNGLGCGFSREEAVLHGLCEYVERHAQRLAELFLINPGIDGDHGYRFVDLGTVSDTIGDLADRLSRHRATVRVLDITSEIRVPTFVATITRQLQRADGYGTHPDPETAIEMALLEAAQTIASATAGGREDLSIQARSLGRHERPRPVSVRDAWFWLDPDPAYERADEIDGRTATDVYDDIVWCLDRLRAAGVEHVLVADLTPPGIEPAHVVRVIVPGLETNNPFYTGPRARLVLLRDLLPRWRRA